MEKEGTNIHWAHSLTLCVVLTNNFLYFMKLHIRFFHLLSFNIILYFELSLGVNAVLGTGAAYPGFHILETNTMLSGV